ncbi:MAG: YgjP-like metallopeptidase domain-containing protein [Bacilli bacterium]
MTYEINGKKYLVIVEKKNNRNTYIRIKEDLTISVTTNYLTSKSYIKNLLDENYVALEKMLNKRLKEIKRSENFFYLGQKYDIIIVPTLDKIEFDNSHIYVKDRDTLNRWYKAEIKRIIEERFIANLNEFKEVNFLPKLKIRKMKTRWGVCNKRDDSVTINSRLIEYSLDKLDYVIIHELSHFVHFDHSKDFWNLVASYCQDYKKIRKELRD